MKEKILESLTEPKTLVDLAKDLRKKKMDVCHDLQELVSEGKVLKQPGTHTSYIYKIKQ